LNVEKGAGFRSMADAWADTTTAHGRLMLTVLGGLAEFERELIRARTDEGCKRAMLRGRSVWTQDQADGAPNPRGSCAPCGRGAAGGDRPFIQRIPLHHLRL
jgi:DNA invertase Pin-like site-specific DNA recombinase